jgi:long-chain acyl-CoA synthetase
MRTISNKIINKLLANKNTANIGFKKNNKWNWITNKQLINSVINCRNILQEHKIDSEDRIAYKGSNSINWISWNLATNSLGATWVPMYADQSVNYSNFIIKDCNPKLLIQDENLEKNSNVQILSNDINYCENLDNNFNFIKPCNDLATLIYTSGTTGDPKGVMLTNENILSNIESVHKLFENSDKTRSLNILPWAHIYSQTSELYYSLLHNNSLAICSNKTQFLNEMKEIKPEVLYLVPRVLELIKEKTNMFDKPIIKNILPLILSRAFGGNLKYIFSGGAKLNNETKKFYENNGIIICEGYGCSETSPMISVNHYNNPRNIDSVGKILDNVIVEIVNNEIQVSGPNVMIGYWNNIEKTNEAIVERNGKKWYKTGDSGEIKDGFLYINSRINDNYKLSNGKFVNVEELESKIKKYISGPFIVFGENMKYNHIICTETIDLTKINNNIDNYLKINNYHKISIDDFEKFYTPKMSVKRKKLIDYIINPIY